jgi:hypothetical protein
MRRSVLSSLLFSLIALLLSPPAAAAQYDLDVKTRSEEMVRLQTVKQGMKLTLEDQPWASVVEFGEDYSLWLTDLERDHRGDVVHVDLNVFLRTPAMLGTGEHVDATRVQLSYHWDRMRSTVQDIPDPESIAESKAEELGTALGCLAGLQEQSAEQLGGELISTLATALPNYPSRMEAVESLLLGQKVARATRKMITGEGTADSDASSAPSIRSVRVTPDPAAPQETIRFSVSGSSATTYRWEFGNGRTASGRSVTHSFRRPGRHEVTVTAVSPSGRDVRSVFVNVEATPHRKLYGTLQSVMKGLSSPWPGTGLDWDQLRTFLGAT